ncbi:MAG: hypothetical protein DCF19_09160 [Pseudanabaena frigida]|uniref:Uncharacterized protein n=1 Tax=Pseudanabaena frigida TaxID=945775 RepID=A0A2W4WA44_9CYAN|nr:MAG: hypothetical protein DCF19_09160 [Pseudanabaena frigida]
MIIIGSVSAAKLCLTMQKLWFKSKRSQSLPPEEEQTGSSSAIGESTQEVATPTTAETKGSVKYFPKFLQRPFAWQISSAWLILILGLGGIAVVTMLGLQYLTAPEATPDSNLACKSQISGDWQTPFGKVTLQEESENLISGKYEYANFERGKIVGELTGKLSNNVVTFDWQETPKQQPKQQGKGILIFAEGCKEFYGSYGTADSTSNFGNWQGSRIPK